MSYSNKPLEVTLHAPPVVPGPGPASRAGHHGAGETRQRAGDLPPGRHALSAGLLPGQKCRCVQSEALDTLLMRRRSHMLTVRLIMSSFCSRHRGSALHEMSAARGPQTYPSGIW